MKRFAHCVLVENKTTFYHSPAFNAFNTQFNTAYVISYLTNINHWVPLEIQLCTNKVPALTELALIDKR